MQLWIGNRMTRLLQYATCIGVLFILVDNQVAESFGCWSFLLIVWPLIPDRWMMRLFCFNRRGRLNIMKDLPLKSLELFLKILEPFEPLGRIPVVGEFFQTGILVLTIPLALLVFTPIDRRLKKMDQIEKVFPGKYQPGELGKIWNENRPEFDRIYRLALDEWFRKYLEEQNDHRKAQQLIVDLEKKIRALKIGYDALMRNEEKHEKEIALLKDELRVLQEIAKDWQERLDQHG